MLGSLMERDIRTNRDNHFDGMTVRARIIDLGDRTIAISNITTVGIAKKSFPYLILLSFLLGIFCVASAAIDISLRDGGPGVRFGFGVLLIIPLAYFMLTRKIYLIITTNDAGRVVFTNRNINLLRHIKHLLDEKINNDNFEMSFFANFAEGSIQKLSMDQHFAGPVNGEAIATHTPGHTPGAMLGNPTPPGAHFGSSPGVHNPMADHMQAAVPNGMPAHDRTGQDRPAQDRPAHEPISQNNSIADGLAKKSWYDKMIDLPLSKSSDWLSKMSSQIVGSAGEPVEPGSGPFANRDNLSGNGHSFSNNGQGFSGANERMNGIKPENGTMNGAFNGTGNDSGGLGPNGFTPDPSPIFGQDSLNGHMGSADFSGMGNDGSAIYTPEAQFDDNNTMASGQIITDYSQHIPKIETIRQELSDPQVTQKLDEMILLMKGGTALDQDKQKLRGYALDLSSYVQAYPPIAKIFSDILRVVGV